MEEKRPSMLLLTSYFFQAHRDLLPVDQGLEVELGLGIPRRDIRLRLDVAGLQLDLLVEPLHV
ncbi:MAG: hypothetical protein ACKPKO_26275, partial [Candidatus Fonsibacter sp.]